MLFLVREWRQGNSLGSKEQGREATGSPDYGDTMVYCCRENTLSAAWGTSQRAQGSVRDVLLCFVSTLRLFIQPGVGDSSVCPWGVARSPPAEEIAWLVFVFSSWMETTQYHNFWQVFLCIGSDFGVFCLWCWHEGSINKTMQQVKS